MTTWTKVLIMAWIGVVAINHLPSQEKLEKPAVAENHPVMWSVQPVADK